MKKSIVGEVGHRLGGLRLVSLPRLVIDLVYEAFEKVWLIRNRLRTVYSRQKSQADNRRRELEFEIGDSMYLKISHMNAVMKSGKKGKLSTLYMCRYEVSKFLMSSKTI